MPLTETSDITIDASLRARFRRRLLSWYRKHRRALPWRAVNGSPANPYHVLLSEAMLQQTQVATVIDYFSRFVAALPTVEALANADEQCVLRLWQGLGYYRRARNLHAAAKRIVEEHGGNVPRTVRDLLQLPGVGRYTAGAIASIAFDEPAAILDGNVARVLARWIAVEAPIDEPAVRERLWSLAAQLVPRKHAGDFNQAMMELGALVCGPKQPACLICPVAALCEAHQRGRATELPARAARRKPTAVTHHVLAIERADSRRPASAKFLFERRGDDSLWAGMWQLPTFESLGESVHGQALGEACAQRFGLTIDAAQRVDRFEHVTTHRLITFTIWRATVTTGRLRPGAGVWRRLSDLDDLPLAKPQQKAVALVCGE